MLTDNGDLEDPDEDDAGARPLPRAQAASLMAAVLQEQQKARARAVVCARQAWMWLARTVVCFVITECPVPHWLGFAIWWVMMICGVAALNYWRAFRVARIQSSLWPT